VRCDFVVMQILRNADGLLGAVDGASVLLKPLNAAIRSILTVWFAPNFEFET
jgi:hypothetical protein